MSLDSEVFCKYDIYLKFLQCPKCPSCPICSLTLCDKNLMAATEVDSFNVNDGKGVKDAFHRAIFRRPEQYIIT